MGYYVCKQCDSVFDDYFDECPECNNNLDYCNWISNFAELDYMRGNKEEVGVANGTEHSIIHKHSTEKRRE